MLFRSGQSQIVFIHGFLGSPNDWNLYQKWFNDQGYSTLALDLNNCELDKIPEGVQPGAHIVGYSMGGRFSLHLSKAFPNFFSTFTLISTNPGLVSKEEIEKRKVWEKTWLEKMESLSLFAFICEWYSQPLFRQFTPPSERFDQDIKVVAKTFRKFSIANLPSLWDHLQQIAPSTLMIFGSEDKKYMELEKYIKTRKPINETLTTKIVRGSHSIHLESPYQILNEIQSFLRNYLCQPL